MSLCNCSYSFGSSEVFDTRQDIRAAQFLVSLDRPAQRNAQAQSFVAPRCSEVRARRACPVCSTLSRYGWFVKHIGPNLSSKSKILTG